MSIIKKTLDMYVNSKAMEKVFLMDRSRTIGASEIGTCARKLGWLKNDKLSSSVAQDPDYKNGWGARTRGNIMEDMFWVKAMQKRFRNKLIIAGKDQRTIQDRYLSATGDGMLIDMPRDFLAPYGIEDIGPSQCVYLECKTIDPRVNLTEEKHEHMFQVQAGMGLWRELSRYKPEYALISYIDASFWDDVDEFVVKFDPAKYQAAHDRAVRIKTADNINELKPEGWIAGGKECEYCPFTKACGVARRSLPVTEAQADPQFIAEITDLCREHEVLRKKAKELEASINEKKDEIKTRLREKSVRSLPGVVTWSPVKGRSSLNMPALKEAAQAAGLNIEDFQETGDPTDMLTVKLKGAPVI